MSARFGTVHNVPSTFRFDFDVFKHPSQNEHYLMPPGMVDWGFTSSDTSGEPGYPRYRVATLRFQIKPDHEWLVLGVSMSDTWSSVMLERKVGDEWVRTLLSGPMVARGLQVPAFRYGPGREHSIVFSAGRIDDYRSSDDIGTVQFALDGYTRVSRAEVS